MTTTAQRVAGVKNIVNRLLVYRKLFPGQRSPWTNASLRIMSPFIKNLVPCTEVSLDKRPLDNCRHTVQTARMPEEKSSWLRNTLSSQSLS